MYVAGLVGARRCMPGAHATTCCCSRSPAAATRRTPTSRNLRNPQTMAAYWEDVTLLFQRVHGAKPVVVHVEPDLWGYLEQAGDDLRSASALRADSGIAAARPARAERDPRLPHERLGDEARHRLREAARRDRARVRGAVGRVLPLAARALRHRVRGLLRPRRRLLREAVEGNPKTWFTPADFRRHLLYAQTFVRLAGVRMVAWQIPLGNTVMRADEQHLGPLPGQPRAVAARPELAGTPARVRRGRLRRLPVRSRRDGATCACDAAKDGVTNPAPINGNTRPSLSADDDGGYFKAQARAYYKAGALPLPGS